MLLQDVQAGHFALEVLPTGTDIMSVLSGRGFRGWESDKKYCLKYLNTGQFINNEIHLICWPTAFSHQKCITVLPV